MNVHLLTLLILASVVFESFAAPQKGDVIFATDFEGTNALAGWSGAAKVAAGFESAGALCVEKAALVQLALPVERVRGCVLSITAMIKAENVSEKPKPWNGVKFMVPVVAPAGNQWPSLSLDTGSFDWKRCAFIVRVPDDATKLTLSLGLEAVSGKAWFDNVRVVVRRTRLPPAPARVADGPVFKGHDLPRLRGAMISPNIDEAGLRTFGQEWNANVIRWQIIRHAKRGETSFTMADYDVWLEKELARLDAALPLCEKYGLMVVVDLHSPPGGHRTVSGYVGSDGGLFSSKAAQDKFVEVWQKMARRYKGSRAVWGYDLANEPVEDEVAESASDWQDLAARTARAVRAIDPKHAIIIEPAQWGNPDGLREMRPLDVPGVVYSVHMYLPHEFTHQGVHDDGSKRWVYPGEIAGKRWDKAALEAALQPVVQFQQRYGAHIYLGEFSAIRWAPEGSAYRYLKDLIEIFESHDWDWTYHAFREWDGWSVEHGDDRANTKPVPTERATLLREWFGKNRKPAWHGTP
ncbi:MAG: cellulase family glycosylhydrolase [Limisphaerales bacterium]